jgi:hypothetical protein
LERVTPVRFIRAGTITHVTYFLLVEEPVAVKVIDMKMLKNEINRHLLESEI